MTEEGRPEGKYYHEVYLEPPPLTPVFHGTARMRLFKRLKAVFDKHEHLLAEWIELEMGVVVGWNSGGRNFSHLIREVLSDLELVRFVTAAAKWAARLDVNAQRTGYLLGAWVKGVNRILREENIAYEVDPKGGVHPYIDRAFSNHVAAVLLCLSTDRYSNVRRELEKGLKALDGSPPDWKDAMRGTFFATEGMFRLMFNETERLVEKYARTKLGQRSTTISDKNEREAFTSLVESFAYWVKAAQQYRHEPGKEEQHQPPPALALLFVDQGLSFLRWLVMLDEAAD